MRYQRDRRRKKWPGHLSDRGGEPLDVTFDPQFWDREVDVGDRRMVFMEVAEQDAKHEMIHIGRDNNPQDPYLDLRLGEGPKSPRSLDEAWGPIVHADVLAIYPLSMGPTKFQVEIKVTDVHEYEPPFDPHAELSDEPEP